MADSTPSAAEGSPRRLDTFGPVIVGGLLVVYFVRTGVESASKALWFDELFTYHFARTGGPREIWQALLGASDAMPPLSFVLTHWSHLALGEGEVATRVPSILGFGLFSYCVYVLLKPRIGMSSALAAMAFSWLTSGFEYATEARPYALVIGFGALALVCWRESMQGERRWWLTGGLFVSLAAAVSCHYYAVFLFLPMAAGEATYWFQTRKLRFHIWICLLAAGSVLFIYLPLIRAARLAYSGAFWSPVWPSVDIIGTYIVTLAPAAWALCAVVVLLAVAGLWGGRKGATNARNEVLFPLPERVALLTAAAIPLIVVGVVHFTTGAYIYRYGLGVLIGLCAGFGVVVRAAARGRDRWVLAVVVLLVGWFALGGPRPIVEGHKRTPLGREDPYGYEKFRDPALPQKAPIVVSSPILFLEHFHYAPEWVRDRLVYVADPDAAVRYRQTDTPDLNLVNAATATALNVVAFDEFMKREPHFLIYERPLDRFAWFLERLQDENRGVRLLNDDGPLELWECCEQDP